MIQTILMASQRILAMKVRTSRDKLIRKKGTLDSEAIEYEETHQENHRKKAVDDTLVRILAQKDTPHEGGETDETPS